MAEVGLVEFAKGALVISKRVMPKYRGKYSEYTFTQPQLWATFCFMWYENWTLRETKVRLQGHRELHLAFGLKQAPDYTIFYHSIRHLDTSLVQVALQETVLRTMQDLLTKKVALAVDITGLAPGAINTFFINRKNDRRQDLP